MQKIGLYDVDGTMPNLALMKVAAYHKKRGDPVEWIFPLKTYDKVYASKIFKDSSYEEYPNMIKGGSGFDLTTTLPKEIEKCSPDYSIYPDCDYSIGFTTRGCIRNCSFCIVPEKEGGIKDHMNIKDIWRGEGNIVLFDNNILAMPEKFEEALVFCSEKNIKIDFNQALDCRLVTPAIAALIKKYRKHIKPYVRFAFDDLITSQMVIRCCRLIGFSCFWYVYCDEDFESAMERLLILKRMKQRPYLMRNSRIRGKKFQKFNMLARWANRGGFLRETDFYDYMYFMKKGKL